MYCEHCGSELSEDARFCAACGSRVRRPSVAEIAKEAGKKTVAVSKKVAETAKPVAKSAVALTGTALTKFGEVAEKTGKKLKKDQ